MRAPSFGRALVTCAHLGVVLIASFASAQPELPRHWFEQRLPDSDRNSVSFCVDVRDPGHLVEAAIAEAIAEVLLVDVRFHVVDQALSPDEYDELYFELVEHCSVYVGFRLYADTYPEWLSFTRDLYEARFVVVTAEDGWRAFEDVPPGSRVGVVQGTLGDVRFILWNNALPVAQRRVRLPLGAPELAFDALVEGRVDALLVWEPWWWWLSQSRPELLDLHVVDAPHISEPAIGVGGAMVADRTFVRVTLDEAISALVADGTIQAIMDGFDYPGRTR